MMSIKHKVCFDVYGGEGEMGDGMGPRRGQTGTATSDARGRQRETDARQVRGYVAAFRLVSSSSRPDMSWRHLELLKVRISACASLPACDLAVSAAPRARDERESCELLSAELSRLRGDGRSAGGGGHGGYRGVGCSCYCLVLLRPVASCLSAVGGCGLLVSSLFHPASLRPLPRPPHPRLAPAVRGRRHPPHRPLPRESNQSRRHHER
jgi:hypothetical protein